MAASRSLSSESLPSGTATVSIHLGTCRRVTVDPNVVAVGGSPAIIRVPVVAAGADPVPKATSTPATRDELLVDRRLVGEDEPERLFAYEVTPGAMKHLRGIAAPGDRIVFRPDGRVAADRICAVRTDQGIVLSRVLVKGQSLLLLPGEGEHDFESVEVRGPEALARVIAGTHVLLIRH